MGPGGRTIDSNTICFWEETDKFGVSAECTFRIDTQTYHLRCFKGDVEKRTSWERLGWEPRFGMDIDDAQHCNALVEGLAAEVDKEFQDDT